MPRRPSASVIPLNAAPANVHQLTAHRPTESHHGFNAASVNVQPPSTSAPSINTTPPPTPQQKIIQVLVNRLKSKLPCNSGLSLDRVEADLSTQQAIGTLIELSRDSLDNIALALTDQLDRLAKQTDLHTGHLTIEILQSQLLLLKVLSAAMASRWVQYPERQTEPEAPPSSPSESFDGYRRASSVKSGTIWQEPPPLDDNCVKYLLSVLILFMRQTSHTETPPMMQMRSTDLSFRDYEEAVYVFSPDDPIQSTGHILRSQPSTGSMAGLKVNIKSSVPLAAANADYEKTHMSLVKSSVSVNSLICKYVGRIIFHMSASNWSVLYERLNGRITYLASHSESTLDTVDLQLMSYSVMDRVRLVSILNQLSSLLLNMRKESQHAVAFHLRAAVWNWIDVFPNEYNEAIRTRGKTEGAPERVFDLLFSLQATGYEKTYWPALAVLLCTTSDKIRAEFQNTVSTPKARKELRFGDSLMRHVAKNSKLSETALVCAIDLCRAASYVDPSQGETPLLEQAPDIAHEIKDALYECGSSRRPFWELYDDIDVALYAEALVAVFRFLPLEISIPLFQSCVEPERSDAVKTCVIRATITCFEDQERFKWQRPFDQATPALAQRCRDILKIVGVRRLDIDQQNHTRRVASRPKGKRSGAEPLSDRELLLLGILSLWRKVPEFYTVGLNSFEDHLNWQKIAVKLWEAPLDISVKLSTATTMQRVSARSFMMPSGDPNTALMLQVVRTSLPITLLSVVGNLVSTRTDLEAQRLWMSVAHQVLSTYTLSIPLEAVKLIQIDSGRLPAFLLSEVSFLVALSSSRNDISQLAARGLRMISLAERMADAPVAHYISDDDRSKRNLIYEQLGDPRITVSGRLAHQKRVRKLARMLSSSIGLQVVVWQECFNRWRYINDAIPSASDHNSDGHASGLQLSPLQQDLRFQWQNLTLFLAALCGTCHSGYAKTVPLPDFIPKELVPDKLRVIEDAHTNIRIFLDKLVVRLGDTDKTIQSFVRDALGAELGPSLHATVVNQLMSVLTDIDSNDHETVVTILDQIISIVKLMTETPVEITLEEFMSTDTTSITSTLARRVNRCPGASGQRLKVKYCGFLESSVKRHNIFSVKKDNSWRHEVLDLILQWMLPPKTTTSSIDPTISIQKELNLACLRATVNLLDRLELRSTDQGDETVHTVSRLFNKYSTALLSSIEVCQSDTLTSDNASDVGSINQKMHTSQKEADLRELVITGLAHLVTANSESGFKQCLPLAYDPDNRKRTIFAHVFARVIGQGTVFDSKDKSMMKARFQSLCELVKGSEMLLALTICDICQPAEVELMISVLLNIFDTRTSLLNLIKLMIEREVTRTDNEANLFRSNSTCTRFLSAFAKLHGYNYLRSLVQPLVNTMLAMPTGTSYEVDPNKAYGQDIAQNQRNVEYVASTFLNLMSSSLPALPGMFRDICAHIAKSVSEVWPDSKYAAMGAFIFLRFISPAVVAPETIDIEVPKNENHSVLRRGLMVIAKIIQNLANNIFFGKEAHMTSLNKFLQTNITNVTRFLSELHKHGARVDDINDNWTGTTSDDTDVIVLHRFFHKHADKIGKELLSHNRPTIDGDGSFVSGKQAWDNFCALLVDLGPPLEVPRLSVMDSSQHREYLEFMAKYSNRNTSSVEKYFIETDIKENTAIFVLRLAEIDIEGLDIELLMYHIFKTLTSDTYGSRSFDVILDCTSFTSNSEVPLLWLKYCTELIPIDIRMRFTTARVLNPNSLMHKYMRRLYNVSAGIPISADMKVYTSVLQLMEDVRTAVLPPLSKPVSLEQEAHESFSDVTMRTAARIPVVLRVGSSHIRVTSIRSLPVSPGVSCKSTELIPLTDVSDIYNVSTGQDVHEFIIRRRQGVTVYFSSPSREQIVKTIRSAKGHLKEAQTAQAERFSRFSNVPATLLHIGFLSVDLNDEELRGAAYDLLGAVCDYLKYDRSPIVACKAGFIPGDPIAFVAQLSEKLAEFAPQLTLDFIHEVSAAITSMDKTAIAHRISCLSYMSPWIQNLSYFANATHNLYERSGARMRDCIRTLADLSLAFPEITPTIQKEIWSEVAKLDAHTVDIVLDELVRTATDGGIGTRRCETISHIISALSSINVRGRIYSKLRKALSKVPPKFTNTLVEHQNWNEISTLIRLTLVVGSQSTQPGQSYLYVPEVVHLVSLVVGEGPALVRKSVYGIVMNLLQSLYLARPDDSTEADLKELIDDCTLPETLKLFGLRRETPTSEYTCYDLSSDKNFLDSHEQLVQLLIRILDVSSGTQGLLNVWRARWMSLVTSTAFQQSPAVQTKSFVVLASLAVSEVDDDFLYQILVAFRSALGKANESNTMVIVSMLRCMCRVVPAVVETSRYICSLFWLAVALLQVSHLGFYVEATSLLRVTLENMEAHGIFRDNSVEAILMEAREQVEEVMAQLDEILRISFARSFSFSLASIIFKGLRHTALKDSAESVLRTLVRVTSNAWEDDPDIQDGPRQYPSPDVLAYLLALIPVSTTRKSFRRLLVDCCIANPAVLAGLDDADEDDAATPKVNAAILGVDEENLALLVASFIGTILMTAQGDDAETEILYSLLAGLTRSYPSVISVVYESLQDRVKEAFAVSSNPSIIHAVSTIFKTSVQDLSKSSLGSHQGSSSTLNTLEEGSIGPSRSHLDALDRLDMQGLANSFQFLPPNRGHATKMINWIPGLVTLMINS
ncbi:hypothetical protein CPB83DRAFT_363170 [Crepidotus variabilis]|uniref:Ras-GAP domain-containing protein n=1 Tax=Crepidotus variabilis TaxID=179855 RepID=A0A9P6EF64_9AGAR|nr:hypothetical protein CPB83DRAFT_363170 [Crepidotus variabilis]